MIILLDMGCHLLTKKKKKENSIVYLGHLEPGILMRETDTKMLPETNAKFWYILQQ